MPVVQPRGEDEDEGRRHEVGRERAADPTQIEDRQEIGGVLLLDDQAADEVAAEHEEDENRDPADGQVADPVRHFDEEVREQDEQHHEAAQAVEFRDADVRDRAILRLRGCGRGRVGSRETAGHDLLT
jgi:hypothetical protein